MGICPLFKKFGQRGKTPFTKRETSPYITFMEPFLIEIELYALSVSKSPEWVLRKSIGASWGQWKSWKRKETSPTLITADKIRAYIASHPAPSKEAVGE